MRQKPKKNPKSNLQQKSLFTGYKKDSTPDFPSERLLVETIQQHPAHLSSAPSNKKKKWPKYPRNYFAVFIASATPTYTGRVTCGAVRLTQSKPASWSLEWSCRENESLILALDPEISSWVVLWIAICRVAKSTRYTWRHYPKNSKPGGSFPHRFESPPMNRLITPRPLREKNMMWS